jgi:hypothetical protein
MTRSNSVIRWPEAGQFWIGKEPLVLMQITAAGDTIVCTQWTPVAEEEAMYVSFSVDRAEYLWRDLRIERGKGWLKDVPFLPGDALLTQDGERLFFIGPETDPNRIHLLASWMVEDHHLVKATLFQPGPHHHPDAQPKTSFERILEDKL